MSCGVQELNGLWCVAGKLIAHHVHSFKATNANTTLQTIQRSSWQLVAAIEREPKAKGCTWPVAEFLFPSPLLHGSLAYHVATPSLVDPAKSGSIDALPTFLVVRMLYGVGERQIQLRKPLPQLSQTKGSWAWNPLFSAVHPRTHPAQEARPPNRP